tara:strand:+ start:427 stop:717 length:291 start_codon:yes stop_codon:yes gene_type:complete
MFELPPSFTHEPPKGYSYEVKEHKRNLLAIWICDHNEYVFNSGAPVKCIWGFYSTKKQQYYAPINHKKCGEEVDISDTRPYTAMQLNLNPLEAAFV